MFWSESVDYVRAWVLLSLCSYVIVLNLIESIWMETTAVWILYLIPVFHRCRGSITFCELRTRQWHPCSEPERESCPREVLRKNAKDFSVVPKVDLMIAPEVGI
jgi:hypothetical protein